MYFFILPIASPKKRYRDSGFLVLWILSPVDRPHRTCTHRNKKHGGVPSVSKDRLSLVVCCVRSALENMIGLESKPANREPKCAHCLQSIALACLDLFAKPADRRLAGLAVSRLALWILTPKTPAQIRTTHALIHIYIYIYICVERERYIYIYVHTCVYIYIYIHTYIYIYIYIYILCASNALLI